MEVTLNLENTSSKDISIMVDAFRASTSITLALGKFNEVIPTFTPEKAKKLAKEKNGILAGERMGKALEGFDMGNSPVEINELNTKLKTLILTTSNGTRILENMKSTVLIGCFINAKAVAKKSLILAKENNYNHIDVVMAGWKGNFAIEDFLASGEILYWIQKELCENHTIGEDFDISEYAQSAILASRDYKKLKEVIYNTKSSKRLKKLGYEKDIELSLKKNINNNVAIYNEGVLKLFK
ncbi:2-phosphosulfolactate phosphatase [Methanobrevibacter arboriphilus JCM 13429 = DSM 1125]|uniref:2-phosphosulfolactate phosphatase n=1 Tax=Methanobrevibacter arboriphilus JCM 13429 = DSM 1125 TaxID=1300164 RepID=A0A1V6N0S1_METAZ|nr:2-phosphosulfolactate phosphatase [Methanobrevibacter arboriphilus]OQD58289.1 2-phosphosulfolactate phosphatase [Methanobrevibacter arboriphilus JCM 13429 = DSM 1125]